MSLAKGLERLGFVHREDFTLEDYSDGKGAVVTWLSNKPQPTMDEIKKASEAFKAEHKSQEYARKRKAEYDQLNQLELIGEDSINGTTNHKDAILAIKAKYPKE